MIPFYELIKCKIVWDDWLSFLLAIYFKKFHIRPLPIIVNETKLFLCYLQQNGLKKRYKSDVI